MHPTSAKPILFFATIPEAPRSWLYRGRAVVTALLLLASGGQAVAEDSRQPDHDDFIIRGATIISPESPHDGQLADVLVSNGQILSVAEQIPGEGMEVIDADGRYLLPGLIDSHVHLYHATGLRRRDTPEFDALHSAYMEQMPRSYLFHGFTTIVELNADPETNAQFLANSVRPNLLHCGPGVVLPDGFMALDVAPDRVVDAFPALLHDPYGGDTLLPGMRAAEHTPDAVLDVIEAAGGRCVKLYYEEALWWPGGAPDFALPSVEIVRQLTVAARAREMPVFLHATTPAGFELGMAAGVDVFAHGPWEWPQDGFVARRPGPQIASLMEALAESDQSIQSTIRTVANTGSLFQADLLNDPAWLDVVPHELLEHLKTDAQVQREQFIARFGNLILGSGGTTDDLPELQRNFMRRYQTLVANYVRDGGRLLFGTDTAVGGFGWASPPGLAGYWEMLDLESAGIPAEVILAAATVSNARALGIGDTHGQIAPGYEADLLLLAADPRQGMAAMNSIRVVWVGGRKLPREALSARQDRSAR